MFRKHLFSVLEHWNYLKQILEIFEPFGINELTIYNLHVNAKTFLEISQVEKTTQKQRFG